MFDIDLLQGHLNENAARLEELSVKGHENASRIHEIFDMMQSME